MGCYLNRKKNLEASVFLPRESQGRGLSGLPLRGLPGAGTEFPGGPERRDGQEPQMLIQPAGPAAGNRRTPRHRGGRGVEARVWQRTRSRAALPRSEAGTALLSPNTSPPSERAGPATAPHPPAFIGALRCTSCNQRPCSEPEPWVPAPSPILGRDPPHHLKSRHWQTLSHSLALSTLPPPPPMNTKKSTRKDTTVLLFPSQAYLLGFCSYYIFPSTFSSFFLATLSDEGHLAL